jgi:hypothetical protein
MNNAAGVQHNKLFVVPAIFLKAIFATIILISPVDAATTYYVATNGNDSNPGTLYRPFLTIQKAVDIMHPGDTVLVRGGVYRETIQPPRGGTGENSRITYKAFPGETPIVKGSERITSWIHQGGGIWKVEMPDAFFGTYNPYTLNLSGAFLWPGQENHLGEVFLDGEPLKISLEYHESKKIRTPDLLNSYNTT